ncbi:MAG: 6-carboxytetrahydropterin synthase [Crocinitomicaceae bacterium]|nr:6-carboxytetrahydropterin synthase [Crocinitomicaceae bacterium]MDG1736122.1 6-carboxytetrahydropterin synthase [Crocinitomicaceae bacterium]MDG2505400.1 6-carboxytetrahydropterin synthase [Crocinitomicaceae bacterium]
MKAIYITRRETFNAAHRLRREDWSDAQNDIVFGKCSNKNWHGHNFELFVTVKGIPSEETGFVMNLKELGTIIKAEIIEKIDHKNINLDVDFMKGIMSSTENLAIGIWNEIDGLIKEKGGELVKIKLIETENNFVEYFGGKEPF